MLFPLSSLGWLRRMRHGGERSGEGVWPAVGRHLTVPSEDGGTVKGRVLWLTPDAEACRVRCCRRKYIGLSNALPSSVLHSSSSPLSLVSFMLWFSTALFCCAYVTAVVNFTCFILFSSFLALASDHFCRF